MKGALCNLASSGKRYECLLKMVQEEGFEPSSLAALDFKSNVYAIPPLLHLVKIKNPLLEFTPPENF